MERERILNTDSQEIWAPAVPMKGSLCLWEANVTAAERRAAKRRREERCSTRLVQLGGMLAPRDASDLFTERKP